MPGPAAGLEGRHGAGPPGVQGVARFIHIGGQQHPQLPTHSGSRPHTMSNFRVPVELFMHTPPLTIHPEAPLEEAWALMAERGVSSLPVTDKDSSLVGILSRTDLLRVAGLETGRRPDSDSLVLPDRPISEEMTREVRTTSRDTPLDEAAKAMVQNRVHRLVVCEDGVPVGILSTRDLMLALEEKQANHPLSDWMSSPVFTIRAEEPVGMAVERLEKARVTGLVVVEDGWPVGMFSQTEALEARDLPRSTAVGDVMNPRILTLSPATRMHRAAAQAAATRVRRVVVQDGDRLVGILSGLDFARAVS
ncbi:MAG: CBS domain-containing protein [Gemmatimonadales bacterium]|nr:MAG: CBS domain-containing protein [Gemmatimonadales bacterium]